MSQKQLSRLTEQIRMRGTFLMTSVNPYMSYQTSNMNKHILDEFIKCMCVTEGVNVREEEKFE